jgi:hypothetical protein
MEYESSRTTYWLRPRCGGEPGYVKTLHEGAEPRFVPVYFRISINEIFGHQDLSAAQRIDRIYGVNELFSIER